MGTTDPIYIDYFHSKILNEIQSEKTRSDKNLFKNYVRFIIDENSEIEGDESNKRKIPTSLLDFLKKEIEKNQCDFNEIKERLTRLKPIKEMKTDWMSHWGFIGNPFSDYHLPCKGEEFVETSTIKKLFDELGTLSSAKTGELKLLFGEKGSGKTTFFFVASEVLGNLPIKIRYIDLGDKLPDIKHHAELFNLIIQKELFSLIRKNEGQEFSEKNFRNAVKEYQFYKYIIFIDTLDALDNNEEQIDMIHDFFRMSQNYFSELRRKFTIVITSSIKWKEKLKEKNVSYLGIRNSWALEPFNKIDVKKLIENRLLIFSKKISDVIEERAIPLLTTLTEGNPRRVLNMMEALCRNAALAEKNLITKEFIEFSHGESITSVRKGIIIKVANFSPYYSEALTRIYMFYNRIESALLEIDRGFEYFKEAYLKGIRIEDIDAEYHRAIFYVMERIVIQENGKDIIIYKLKQQIIDFINELIKEGLTLEEFIFKYKEEQILPNRFKKDITDINENPDVDDEVKYYLKEGIQLYKEIIIAKYPPVKKIRLCWECIENLIKALALYHKIMTKEQIDSTTKRDHLNRPRMSILELIQEGKFYRDKVYQLPKIVGYISSIPEISHILKKRNQILNIKPSNLDKFSESDMSSTESALKSAYPELMSLFIKKSN